MPSNQHILLQSLIAQRRICRGDDCRRPTCKRCLRGLAYRAREDAKHA